MYRRPIRMIANIRAARFIGVGLVATGVDFIVFNLALLGDADPPRGRILLANTLAFGCATLVGYLLNSRLTWQVQPNRRSLVRYAMIAVVGVTLYDGALIGMIHATDAEGYLALNGLKVAAVALSATWNFFGFTFFAFRDGASRPPVLLPEEVRR